MYMYIYIYAYIYIYICMYRQESGAKWPSLLAIFLLISHGPLIGGAAPRAVASS